MNLIRILVLLLSLGLVGCGNGDSNVVKPIDETTDTGESGDKKASPNAGFLEGGRQAIENARIAAERAQDAAQRTTDQLERSEEEDE